MASVRIFLFAFVLSGTFTFEMFILSYFYKVACSWTSIHTRMTNTLQIYTEFTQFFSIFESFPKMHQLCTCRQKSLSLKDIVSIGISQGRQSITLNTFIFLKYIKYSTRSRFPCSTPEIFILNITFNDQKKSEWFTVCPTTPTINFLLIHTMNFIFDHFSSENVLILKVLWCKW